MLEWITVLYPRTRDVYIDDELSGATNQPLAVAQGTLQVDLGSPTDYTPAQRRVTVTGTSQTRPREIVFTPKS
jgi:hypothetical protein